MYIDNLDYIVNKYNNTYQSTIKTEPVDVKSSSYIDVNVEKKNEKDPKFKAGSYLRISKHKNIFAKDYTPNLSEEVFVIKKFKNTLPWTCVIEDLNGEETVGNRIAKDKSNTV